MFLLAWITKYPETTKQQKVKFLQINTNFWINKSYPFQNIPLNAKAFTFLNNRLDFHLIDYFNCV